MIIGITGPSGSGKTTLLGQIEKRGGVVFDCDRIYHRLLETDAALLRAIEGRFPGVAADGKLDRKKLGQLVFGDEQALADLNRITHGAVAREVRRGLAGAPLAAIDAIGLFESGLDTDCDVTVAVTAPRELRIRRLMGREGISRQYAEKRVDAQHSDDWFRERCSHTLENTGNFDAFATKCIAFLDSLGIMEKD